MTLGQRQGDDVVVSERAGRRRDAWLSTGQLTLSPGAKVRIEPSRAAQSLRRDAEPRITSEGAQP